MSGTHRPERWSAESGRRDVVQLDIPADALRERSFEICCRLVVRNPAGRRDATHAMRVLVDGALEWSRQVETHAGDAGTVAGDDPRQHEDSLDLRLHRQVPIGRPLRVSASCELRVATRVSLTIVAEEA